MFTDDYKVLILKFLGMKNGIFWAKKFMEWWYLPVIEKFFFWTFRWCEIRYLLSQEVDRKDDIYLLQKISRFELFGGGKYGLFLCQELDGKMIFTWSFWGFHDIPGPGKYGYSSSDDCVR